MQPACLFFKDTSFCKHITVVKSTKSFNNTEAEVYIYFTDLKNQAIQICKVQYF